MSTDAFPACQRCGGPRIEPFCGNCDYQPPPWPDYPRAIIEDMVRFSRMPYGIEARRPHPAAPVASVGVEVQGVVTDTHRNKLTIAIDGNMPDEYQQAAMRGGVRVSVRLADPTEGG